MSYRSILVVLDGSQHCDARVALAARLALAQDSHLVGVAPTGLVNLPSALQPYRVDGVDLVATARQQIEQRAADAVHRFKTQVAPLGLASYEGHVHDDEMLSAVLQNARTNDLVVLGQNDPKHFSPLVSSDFPQQVFLHAGRPVLVVPCLGEFERVGQRVVVAWDDSQAATRAVTDALPLLRQAAQVEVLCLTRSAEGQAAESLQALAQWLGRHGVQAQTHHEVTQGDISQRLLSQTAEWGADLLVMGGYGHARLTELLMGGVTRNMLSHMTVPVLISH